MPPTHACAQLLLLLSLLLLPADVTPPDPGSDPCTMPLRNSCAELLLLLLLMSADVDLEPVLRLPQWENRHPSTEAQRGQRRKIYMHKEPHS
jgi:hypothetical protein